MTDEQQRGDRKRSGPLAVVGLMLLALPLLYVFSVGPAQWMLAHGYTTPATDAVLVVFYAPLGWLSENCEPIGDALTKWLQLWSG